ncbi:hypothetical protein ACXWR7_13500, partial [Streptococcus pyogenes]
PPLPLFLSPPFFPLLLLPFSFSSFFSSPLPFSPLPPPLPFFSSPSFLSSSSFFFSPSSFSLFSLFPPFSLFFSSFSP